MGHFAGLLRQGFVVIGAGGKRVEREVKLIFPAEFKAGLRHRVIANLRARMAFRQVRSVGGNFVGDKPLLHVLFVGQTEVLFWRHIAEHGATEPADHCRTNSGGEVVVTRGNIGGQRPQGIEWCFMAVLQFFRHIAADHLHGDMARAFNHHLHVILPGDFGQLAQRVQFSKLRFVVGITNGTRAQAVAQRQRDVVSGTDFADLAEVFVEEVFLMMRQTPLRHD